VTINALVAGRFHCQSSTSALRRSCHQPSPAFAAPIIGWLLRPCPLPAFVIACRRATVDTLFASRFCRQSSTTSLRQTEHQPPPALGCSRCWLAVVLLSSCRRPLLSLHTVVQPSMLLLSAPFATNCWPLFRQSPHQPLPAFAAPIVCWLLLCCPPLPPTFVIAHPSTLLLPAAFAAIVDRGSQAVLTPAAACLYHFCWWLIVASSLTQRQQQHHNQRTNGNTKVKTFTSPDDLDLFNLSTVLSKCVMLVEGI
jgi:hypothetical protein